MTAELVDYFKSIPDILNIIPANQRLNALALIIMFLLLLGFFHFNVLNLLSEKAREKAIFMILRYGFIGLGAIFLTGTAYNLVTFKYETAQATQAIKNLGSSTQAGSSDSPIPILRSSEFERLAESLVLLSRQYNAPPGISDALTQLNHGDPGPAIAILQNEARQQTTKQADTWRQVGLLAFYKDTALSLQAYKESTKLDPDNWQAWSQIAFLLERQADHDGAKAAAQKVIEIGNLQHDKKALAAGYASLGYIDASAGRVKSAEQYLEKARDDLRDPDAAADYARVTASLARVKYADGQYDQASELYQDALNKNNVANNQRGVATDYIGIAQLLIVPQDGAVSSKALDEATDYLEKALAISKSLNDKHQQSMALTVLGEANLDKANLNAAEKNYGDALSLENELGYRLPAIYLTGKLANIAHRKQNDAEAENKYLTAITMSKDIKNSFAEAVEQRGLGTLYFQEKKFGPAASAYRRAVEIDRSLKRDNYLATDLRKLGQIYVEQDQIADACASYREAMGIFQRISDDDFVSTQEALGKISCPQ